MTRADRGQGDVDAVVDSMRREFQRWILCRLQAMGWKQRDLAARIGVTEARLSHILRDTDHNYSLLTMQRIVSALDGQFSISLLNGDGLGWTAHVHPSVRPLLAEEPMRLWS